MSDSKPFFKFYPNDWLSDYELRNCSLEARGLLIELLCIAHPDGTFKGSDEELKKIARSLRTHLKKIKRILDELNKLNRVNFDEKSQLYSIPRMVRDHEKYQQARGNGQKGGNPNLVKKVNPEHKLWRGQVD